MFQQQRGHAEETAACMYIHYCRLGMRGEIMCFSSVSDCQNKVYTVLELHSNTAGPERAVVICWNMRAGVLWDKIITGYLWWPVFKSRKTVSRKRWHLNSAESDLFQPHFLLERIIEDVAFITSEGEKAENQAVQWAPADLVGDRYQSHWHTDLLGSWVENAAPRGSPLYLFQLLWQQAARHGRLIARGGDTQSPS